MKKKLFDYTEQNIDSLIEKRKLRNNITKKPVDEKESILEDVDFVKQTKKALLETALKQTNVDSPSFDELLEDYVLLMNNDISEDQKETLKERVKFDIKNSSTVEEATKPKYVADRYLKRAIPTLSEAIVKNK